MQNQTTTIQSTDLEQGKIKVLLIGSNCKGVKEVRLGKEIKKIKKILGIITFRSWRKINL